MALIRSLTSGTSSLKAHQQRFDVISNNIANVNTIGYKSSRATFADQFSQSFSIGSSPNVITGGGIGGINPMQIGLGVRVASVETDFSQGSIKATSRPTDLALQGKGFFVVERNGQEFFTRAGSFSFDRDGFLVDSATGAYIQGYNLQTTSDGRIEKDGNGVNVLNRAVSNIQIPPSIQSAPRQTQRVTMAGNLNSDARTGAVVNPTITIYDNQGSEHTLRLQLTKAGTNTFDIQVFIDGDTANPITISGVATAGTTQQIGFNGDGTLNNIGGTPPTAPDPIAFTLTAADLNAALSTINGAPTTAFDAGTPKDLEIVLAETSNLLGGLTQFAAQDTVSTKEQDGYAAGELKDINVDQTGKIVGAFTNGQSELLGQLVIAQFTNPGGLQKQGGNYYSVSPNSGLPFIGTAVEIFPATSVASKSLEESNVDLTDEFTELISTQRAFEAASRTITLSDQFLGEINQLKR